MTMVVPSAPTGPRASPSSSDRPQAHRSTGDVDFATALSETAGEAGENAGGDEPTANVRDIARPPTKAVHGLDARERRAATAVDKADSETPADRVAEMTGDRLGAARDVTMPPVADRALSQQVPDAAPARDHASADAGPVPQPTPARGDSVRDALAALAVDVTSRRDMVAPAEKGMTQSRRQFPAGVTPPVAKQSQSVLGETAAPDGPDLPGDVPDIGAIPVRVLRQESHFQPVAHEVRRLLGMNVGAADDRVLPLTLAAAAKISRPQALQPLSQDAPVMPESQVEPAGPLAPSSLALSQVAADGATFGAIGQQIADAVQRAMASPAEPATTRSVPGADPAAAPAFAPALRTIKLQLNPHSLGVVTVVLTGSDGDLRIHLEAERAETFGKVEQERGVLSARLNGAGYAITEVTVGRTAAADAQGRDGEQRDAAPRQGNHAGGQQGDTAGGGARQSAEQFADQRARRESGGHASSSNAAVAASAAKGGTVEQTVAGFSYSGRFRPV
jgi:hypothetical protein